MRILVISNLYPPNYLGGYELECQQVVDGLRDRGHNVQVLTSKWGEKAGDEKQVERRLNLIPPFPRQDFLGRLERAKGARENQVITSQVIESYQPDAIFMWSQLRLTAGPLRAAQRSGLPVCFRFGDDHLCAMATLPWTWSLRRVVRNVLDRWVCPELSLHNCTISNASYVSNLLRERMQQKGVSPNNTVVIHRGIPLASFPFRQERAAWNGKTRLLYVGQLHHYKGVHEVIEGLTGFDQEVSFTIVGDGNADYVADLKRSAQSKPFEVNFLGKVEYADLQGIYADHDVFVFPSIWEEPQGATYLEAMACGLPVLATIGGGQDEILREGRNAFTYQKFDRERFQHQLRRIIQDRQVRNQICQQARRDVENLYSLKQYIKKTEQWLLGTL